MNPRTFARQFRAQTAMTPARLVERLRIETARQRLEQTADTVTKIAHDCGLGTAETMRRAFLRNLGVTSRLSRPFRHANREWFEAADCTPKKSPRKT